MNVVKIMASWDYLCYFKFNTPWFINRLVRALLTTKRDKGRGKMENESTRMGKSKYFRSPYRPVDEGVTCHIAQTGASRDY